MTKKVFLSAVGLAMVSAASPALAVCPINTSFDRTLTFGAAADAHYRCGSAIVGGGGQFAASANFDRPLNDWHTRASAALGTGVLTAWASSSTSTENNPIYAAATFWDTFTFRGLPSGGGTLTSTLYLTGMVIGAAAEGTASFTVGNFFANGSFNVFTSATGVPASVSYNFTAFDGVPIKLGAQLEAYLNGPLARLADLEDPPTFAVVVPMGVTFTSSSGVFNNVVTSPVPEIPTWTLMLAGLGLFAGVSRANRRRPVQHPAPA